MKHVLLDVICFTAFVVNGCNAQATKKPESDSTANSSAPSDKASASPVSSEKVLDEWREEDNVFPRLHVIGKLVNDKVEGELRGIDARGRLVVLESYESGIIRERTTFSPTGKKFNHVSFDEGGKASGEYTVWFENEKLKSTIMHVNGMPHGKHIEYHMDGTKMTVNENVNGVAQGEVRHYLSDGTMYAIELMEDGQRVDYRIRFPVTHADLAAKKARNAHSSILKDHWRDDSR